MATCFAETCNPYMFKPDKRDPLPIKLEGFQSWADHNEKQHSGKNRRQLLA